MAIYRQTNGEVYLEYQINATTTASSPQQLAFVTPKDAVLGVATIIVEARGATINFNFGNNSVVASNTVTSNALPAGNYSVTAGAIQSYDVNIATQNYVSVIAASGTGTAVIKLIKSYR